MPPSHVGHPAPVIIARSMSVASAVTPVVDHLAGFPGERACGRSVGPLMALPAVQRHQRNHKAGWVLRDCK